jgi:DNA-binding transcriptional ArsR family regulator
MVYSDHIRLLNPALPERQPLYQYGYAIDPDAVMSCPRLKPAARLVYRGILRLCGRGTSCRASVEQIASQAGVSVRSVQRHVSILTRLDLVETEEEPGSPTIFRLLPLPAWLVEGRKPVLPEKPRPGTGDRGPGTGGSGSDRGFPSSVSCLPSAPEGRQPDGGGVTVCHPPWIIKSMN